ncbi:MAG: hypothetical protein KAI17_14715 [Thiotrichaceae bacterium]|nr:hypothetical protein [Thiotrichaceae bacterium]
MIDSPGFDADEQRNSTLKITDHIMDLADLVLVFFDARHPEPGAMKDTLDHLVKRTIQRNDAGKFLFILNQMDSTAKEDNAEQVVAAWQRAIVSTGLSTGRFYCIYNERIAPEIEDEHLRKRYKDKLSIDMNEILNRMQEVKIERVYRIIATLENIANQIEQSAVPQIKTAIKSWSNSVLKIDAVLYILLLASVFGLVGYMGNMAFIIEELGRNLIAQGLTAFVALFIFGSIHFWVRGKVAARIAKTLPTVNGPGNISAAFLKNTRPFYSVFFKKPTGWGRRALKIIDRVRNEADTYVKTLNDDFADPLGRKEAESNRQSSSD